MEGSAAVRKGIPKLLVEGIAEEGTPLSERLLHDQVPDRIRDLIFPVCIEEVGFIDRSVHGTCPPVENDPVLLQSPCAVRLLHAAQEKLSGSLPDHHHVAVTRKAPGHAAYRVSEFLVEALRHKDHRHLPVDRQDQALCQSGAFCLGAAVYKDGLLSKGKAGVRPFFGESQVRVPEDGPYKGRAENARVLPVAHGLPAGDPHAQYGTVSGQGHGNVRSELSSPGFPLFRPVVGLHQTEGPGPPLLPVKGADAHKGNDPDIGMVFQLEVMVILRGRIGPEGFQIGGGQENIPVDPFPEPVHDIEDRLFKTVLRPHFSPAPHQKKGLIGGILAAEQKGCRGQSGLFWLFYLFSGKRRLVSSPCLSPAGFKKFLQKLRIILCLFLLYDEKVRPLDAPVISQAEDPAPAGDVIKGGFELLPVPVAPPAPMAVADNVSAGLAEASYLIGINIFDRIGRSRSRAPADPGIRIQKDQLSPAAVHEEGEPFFPLVPVHLRSVVVRPRDQLHPFYVSDAGEVVPVQLFHGFEKFRVRLPFFVFRQILPFISVDRYKVVGGQVPVDTDPDPLSCQEPQQSVFSVVARIGQVLVLHIRLSSRKSS